MKTMASWIALACAAACAAAQGKSVAFPLEWCEAYRTDVPYEVEIMPGRLGGLGGGWSGVRGGVSFAVMADGKALGVEQFEGKAPGSVALRFRVPPRTRALTCRATTGGDGALRDSSGIDNLLAGALSPANVGKWNGGKSEKNTSISISPIGKGGGGLLFRGIDKSEGGRFARYSVDLPEGLAGMPVVQEMDLRSRSPLVWGGKARILQLDAEGRTLPETVADPRWTSHMRPPGKLARYRDDGRIHPAARKLVVEIELRTLGAKFDDYGRKIEDRSVCLPALEVTRLAVRPAARLPFPKWDDSFFGPPAPEADGSAARPGSASMRLGGEDGKAMFYQVLSRGAWSDSYQFRREEDRYFPAGAGTVEAQFRPDWAALAARAKANGQGKNPVALFEAHQGYRAAQRLQGMGVVMRLAYHPGTKALSLAMKDWKGHSYSGSWKGVEIADGEWSHVALQWRPAEAGQGGKAEVFVNGARKAELAMPEFEATPIGDKAIKNVNDLWAMELYLGATCAATRMSTGRGGSAKWCPVFEGLADNLRVSTGCRYGRAGAKPPASSAVDAATRALFAFDRSFDGVSGGGFGHVPASVWARRDRVDHVLAADGRKVQYYPAENLPENDPFRALEINNYPVMPSPGEYRASRRLLTKGATLAAGDVMRFRCGDVAYPEWVEFEHAGKSGQLLYPILVGRGRLDPRSFGDLADSMAAAGGDDRAAANRVFQYVISASDYFMNHQLCFSAGADAPHSACYEAMIMLNSYCGFECGPLNNLTANLFSTIAGCLASQTGGYGHSFQQVFYDGKNHIYDLSAQKFFPAMDNETVAYLKEAGDQPGLFNRVNGSSDHFIRRSTRGHWVQNPSYQERVAMTLNPGERFRVWYSNNGRMNNLQTWGKRGVHGHKGLRLGEWDYAAVAGADDSSSWIKREDRFFPHYSTGTISFDGRPIPGSPAIERREDGSFCYRVRCCYPITWGEYGAWRRGGRAVALELSTDFGKTFREIPRGANGVSRLEYRVKGRHDYLLRVKAPLADVERLLVRTDGEVNSRTYPGWAAPGENEMTFKAEPGQKAKVTVAWSEPAKEIVVSGGVYSGAIPGRERQVALLDPAVPLALDVSGVSPGAKAKCFGKVKASLSGGRLTLAYDAARPAAMLRGDDLEAWYASDDPTVPRRAEFPCVAGVEISDGGCAKRLTVIVSPGARLLRAGDAELGPGAELRAADADSPQDRVWLASRAGGASFRFPKIAAGKYAVFALARFASHGKNGAVLEMANPASGGDPKAEPLVVARRTTGTWDYLKAEYGRKGGRSRWKWDTSNLLGKEYGQSSFEGWIVRAIDFPETERIDLRLSWDNPEGVELAAVMVLPEPDLECLADLRKVLFGLNCDPFFVR